ncbi:MAG: translocation/assembly module TamB domain-containing protein [Myxococcota bacterium]
MSGPDQPHVPLIRQSTVQRVLTGLAVALALVFFAASGLLIWALQTGRAVEYARRTLEQRLRAGCGVEAEFTHLRLDPLRRTLQLSELSIRESDGQALLSVDEALVTLSALPLLYGRFQLERVALLAPRARLVFREGSLVNLPACLGVEPGEPTAAPTSPLVALGVDELVVERGAFDVEVEDSVRGNLADIGVRLAPGRSGGTDLTVGVDDGRFEISGQPLVLQRFRFIGHLAGRLTSPRALVVDSLEAALEGARVVASGSVDLVGPVADLQLEVDTGLPQLRSALPGAPPMKGRLRSTLSLTGTLDKPRARGELQLDDLAVDRFGPFERIRLEFVADRSAVELQAFEIRLERGGLTGTGRIQFESGLPTELDLDTEDLSLAEVLQAVGVPHPWVDFSATGPTQFFGTLKPVRLGGPFDFQLADLVVFDRPFDDPSIRNRSLDDIPEHLIMRSRAERVRGRWTYRATGLQIEDAVIEGPNSRGEANATIPFKGGRSRLVEANFEPLDMDDVGPLAGVSVRGAGRLQASLEFPRDQSFGGTGSFELGGLRVGGVPLGDVQSTVAWRERELEFSVPQGNLAGTPYSGRTKLRFQQPLYSEIDVDVRRGRLQDLLLPADITLKEWGGLDGTFKGSARLVGPWGRPTGTVTLDADAFQLGEEAFEGASLRAKLEAGGLRRGRLSVSKEGERLDASGRYEPDTGAMAFRLSLPELRLERTQLVRRWFPGLRGRLAVQADVSGSMGRLRGDWSLGLTRFRAGERRFPDLRAAGAVKDSTVAGTVRTAGFEAEGKVRLEEGLPVSLAGRLEQFPALGLSSRLLAVEFLDDRTDGTFRLEGPMLDPTALDGRLVLNRWDVAVTGSDSNLPSASLDSTAELRLSAGALRTDGLRLQGEDLSLAVQGRLGPRDVNARVNGRIDLAVLERLTRSAERASGSATFDAGVVGPMEAPRLVGTGRVTDGLLRWSGFDDPFTDLFLQVDFSRSAILIDGLRARWAGGTVDGGGSVRLRGDRERVEMTLDIRRARPRFIFPVADVVARVDGSLTITGGRPLLVRGDLRTVRPLIEPRVDLRSLAESQPTPDAYDPESEGVDFDIGFDIRDPIRVRGDFIDAQLEGDLRFTGTNQRPGLLGSASFKPEGRVSFLGRDYSVVSGVVEFQDRYRFEPEYDLVFRTEACSARIRVGLTGSMTEFDTNYSSTPDLSQRDIVSCLIRGIRIREVDDQRAIGAFAGSALLKISGVDQEVKKVIPVDQIDFTTEFSRQAREYQPRLLVAKELSFFDRSARLEYSSSLVATSDQRAAVRLRLLPRLTLQLGWTSSLDVPLGDWGLDLKHRWEW